jgi:phospholipid/cholesterol/gamma-HCH transport system permease protein
MSEQQAHMRVDSDGKILRISGQLDKRSVAPLYSGLRRKGLPPQLETIDIHEIESIDTSGVAFLEWLQAVAGEHVRLEYSGCGEAVVRLIEEFLAPLADTEPAADAGARPSSPSRTAATDGDVEASPGEKPGLFERLGGSILESIDGLGRLLVLTAEIFYWSAVGMVSRAQRRAWSVLEQCLVIGVQSLPLIALLSLILGVILSLQSAIQLRTFGANIYVADLMAISMVKEMGPMMSAILVAGRSGSAIASEIATMRVSEEIEALEIMGVDPIRYVVVPKFLGITLTIPLLVAFSIYLGIGGGILVGLLSLEIAPEIFFSRAAASVSSMDVVVSLTKSVFFGWVIVIISSHFGFSVSGGAEEVGRATTQAVVYSIISVIVLDALFSLTSLI